MTTPADARRAMFRTTEGDLWRWQLETLNTLTTFIRAHGPGKRGALPAVRWNIDTGFHAVARLSEFDGPGDARRNRRDVLAAYAEAFGSQVTSIDLSNGDTEYRVQGALGERERIKLTVIAVISADEERAMHWPARGLLTTTLCQGEPLTRESFVARESEVTCPGCLALLDEVRPARAARGDTSSGSDRPGKDV
jgi:hypothetical protein